MITMDGTRVAVGRGDAARDGHPVLAAAPGLFARLSVRFDAEPGAGTAVTPPPQRSPGRSRKTAAAALTGPDPDAA
jgi:hypothetical protein